MNSIIRYVLNAVVSLKVCQTEFLRVFNFAILSYLRNSRKFDAHEKYVFYSVYLFIYIFMAGQQGQQWQSQSPTIKKTEQLMSIARIGSLKSVEVMW